MSEPDRPNVVLIVTDDQRFDAIGALSDTQLATPNLDRLLATGCTFTHAHNMGSPHGAVCVPARSMIHSGRSLFHLDGPGGMTTTHPTLPEAFDDAGYRTFATGKWHNGEAAFNRCYAEGRNVFFGGMGNHWNVPVIDRRPTEEYPTDRPHRFLPGDERGPQPVGQTYERYAAGTHSSELFADTTVEFIHEHDSTSDPRPFFSYTAFMAPHDPRTAPGEFHSLYDPGEIALPANFREEHPFDNGHLRTRDENLATHPRDPDEIRRHIADYFAMITHLDAQVGRILDALERTDSRDETIVVFTADHGLAVGQHGLLGKQNVYDHSVRVPLIVSGPDVPAGTRRSAFTYHHDLYPTLADWCGIDVPETIDGVSLVATITDDVDSPRAQVFTAFGDTQRAVRTHQYKLIEYAVDGEQHTQLFDIEQDPAETQNLADDDRHEADVNRLRQLLTECQDASDDPLQLP